MMKSLFFLLQCLFLQQVLSFTTTSTTTTSAFHNVHKNSLNSLNTPTFITQASTATLSSVTRVPSTSTPTTLFGKKAARAKGNDRKNKTERVKKQKDDVIEVEAVVIESLPNAMFRCTIDGAPETQPPILATISGKIRKNYVKVLVGDKVTIELSPYDLTRGRITFRHR